MNTKQRIEAVFHGQKPDRLPFWPKISGSYLRQQTGQFAGLSMDEMHTYIGSDYFSFDGVKITEVTPPGISIEQYNEGEVSITRYEVNGHRMEYHEVATDEVDDAHPTVHPITDLRDIEAMTKFYDSVEFTVSPCEVKRHKAYVAAHDDRFFITAMPPSPLMDLVQYKMGIEQFSFLSYDYPHETDALIAAMHRALMRRYTVMCENTDIEYCLSVENTSTTLISPDLFHRYCLPHLKDYNSILAKHGKKQMLHMCGKLKMLLPDLAKIPAVAMEAFTSPSVGDTTISDGYTGLPGRVIIGGSGASLWATQNPTLIAETILRDIKAAGGTDRLILSSGGEIPYTATPDIIKEVKEKIHKALQ